MSNYNLSELFHKAFGTGALYYTQEAKKNLQDALVSYNFKGIKIAKDYYPAEATSWMGTPIIGICTLKGGTYQKYNSSGVIVSETFSDFMLPPATLFTFRRPKIITETNVLGNNGTVKEIFGFDDWIIDVKGLAVDTPNVSATEQIKELIKWNEIAGSIPVSGKLFTDKKVHYIAIYDLMIDSVQGSPGVIPFSMPWKSDESLELILGSDNEDF